MSEIHYNTSESCWYYVSNYDVYDIVWNDTNICTILSHLPAALIEDTIFCMHGGLSPDFTSFQQVSWHLLKVFVNIPHALLGSNKYDNTKSILVSSYKTITRVPPRCTDTQFAPATGRPRLWSRVRPPMGRPWACEWSKLVPEMLGGAAASSKCHKWQVWYLWLW